MDNITDPPQDFSSSSLTEIFPKPKAFYGKNPLLTGENKIFEFLYFLFFFLFFFFFIVSIFCFLCVLLQINIFISSDFLCFLVSVPLEGEVEEEAPMSVRTVDSERSESSKGSNYSHGNSSFFRISFTIFFLFFCVDGNFIVIYSDLFNYQDF